MPRASFDCSDCRWLWLRSEGRLLDHKDQVIQDESTAKLNYGPLAKAGSLCNIQDHLTDRGIELQHILQHDSRSPMLGAIDDSVDQ